MKPINEELLNVKAGDIYSYHCALKGYGIKEVLYKIDPCKY
jgi:hypothetical protein